MNYKINGMDSFKTYLTLIKGLNWSSSEMVEGIVGSSLALLSWRKKNENHLQCLTQ